MRSRAGRPEKPAFGTPAEANIGPSSEITAMTVGFGHLVPLDTVIVERRVLTSRGMLGYEFPVAGLAPWLCLKADAIMRRDKPKDAYDVGWLIDALGPERAAEMISASPLLANEMSDEVIAQLDRLITDQFHDLAAAGPTMYASFLGTTGGERERRHAHGSLKALASALHHRGIQVGS
jgi:hypothetical protein